MNTAVNDPLTCARGTISCLQCASLFS